MGCNPSKEGDDSARRRNNEIEEEIRRRGREARNEVKILLLGAGESGKSTVLKQMRLMNQIPFSDRDREEYREIIFDNAVRAMQAVIEGFSQLELIVPKALEDDIRLILAVELDDMKTEQGCLDPQLARAIETVWSSQAAKQAVLMSHEFQLTDSAPYYFDSIARLAQPGYTPTDQDILRARVKSTGIVEVSMKVENLVYRCFDVGGQRAERRKWVHCFEGVEVLLFLIAINEFNQQLYEDESTSRIVEATTLWKSIVNSRWFSKTNVILFLNKIDLFKEKLVHHRLSDYLPEYEGENLPQTT
ncbi:guanine nucleotide binding protein, alpha subunit [Leucosporidium creatinivorum]|uniref:Guanine nucleotide binding protein, alpha subunit n=1 Tax=Leucosporidium creatinivorum TaxID=106004 RepID=A0A1Y2DX35_9BASI|nr:guanine nucleotide binding protein, alpha subunit [Leucosporidium creatinivorum]